MAEVLRCPGCYQKLAPSDFQCPRCELLLEDHLDDEPTAPGEVSVVRALMERPQGTVSRARPVPPAPDRARSEMPTALYPVPLMLAELTPTVVAGLTLTELALTPFEAFVVWSIDGKTAADKLLSVLQLQYVELQAVLTTLESRGILALNRPQPAPAPRRPATPPPPPVIVPAAQVRAAPPAPKRPSLPPPVPISKGGGERGTDSRVQMADGVAKNRKILDALKQVKKSTAPEPAKGSVEAPRAVDDLAAEGSLQVAIRMEQDGRIDEAVRYLERAIARSPDAAPLLNRLAIVLVRDRKSFGEAERLLRRALKLAPDHPVYKKNLVMVLTRAARENTGIHRRR